MYLDLSGEWHIRLETKNGVQEGRICLPGILQAQGYGDPIDRDTPWVSSLHDPFFWEREEYKREPGEAFLVPFCAQPPRHFLGEAVYERAFAIPETAEEWLLYLEAVHWRTKVWVDGKLLGGDCSLCTAHKIGLGRLTEGVHRLSVAVDNSMQYPYRPDGHGVSDALGASWNGIAGEIALMTAQEWRAREEERRAYANAHPRRIEVRDKKFYVDGRPEYFRGTHMGGEYPLTGYPACGREFWKEKFEILKKWGLNFVRCHSFCPPEAAFAAADEAGVYLQPECGMWNHFEPGIPMLDVLREETVRILSQFGHHPSFVLFSSGNEPDGDWEQPLKEWVKLARETDRRLGYEGRRVYTAQSGWHYSEPPKDVEGVDYLYFHRSGFGPYLGGRIRGPEGWQGRDYAPSLEGAVLPCICHELGQWTSYPDFRVMEKFTGYLQPGNYRLFSERAEKSGLLSLNRELAYASGRNQVRLYKEDLEANFRTQGLEGFELLDLHDYLGQGSALVGILDAFWENKGYVTPEEFRLFCGPTVLLARFGSYVYGKKDRVQVPLEICHYGQQQIRDARLEWELIGEGTNTKPLAQGNIAIPRVLCGQKLSLGSAELSFGQDSAVGALRFVARIRGLCCNQWPVYVYEEQEETAEEEALLTRDWTEARKRLLRGERVVYMPHLSDLDYDCPPVSLRNVFWNGQMGPAWGRSLGLLIQKEHPLFSRFPTEADGGWQWEDILAGARGFWMDRLPQIDPIVRVIDDWNRGLSLSLIWEAQVEQGRLLMVTADLEGSHRKRPAARALRKALTAYAASPAFAPSQRASLGQIEARLFPVRRMEQITQSVTCQRIEAESGTLGGEALQARHREPFCLAVANPDRAFYAAGERYPIRVDIELKEEMEINGLLYVPAQRSRMRDGFVREYEIFYRGAGESRWRSAARGSFLNTSLSQRAMFLTSVRAVAVRFCVLSAYGGQEGPFWIQDREGYHAIRQKKPAAMLAAGLHVICPGDEEGRSLGRYASDRLFWAGEQKSATKEIEA